VREIVGYEAEEDSQMKGKRYSEEQIVRILQEVDGGKSVAGVCREYGVSEQSVYRWRTKYGGMEVSDVRRLRQLEEENRRLKKLAADQALDIQLLKEINSKKW
jgi:putative transposase